MEASMREVRTYRKGEVIFNAGDQAACMYDIHWGQVGIYAHYGTKQEKLLTTLQADEFFGEMGLVDLETRSATAVALETDTKVEIITRESFGVLLQERPAKVLTIMQHMSHRLRKLTKDYVEVCGTVAETVNAENKGQEKNEELLKKQKKFSEIYLESVQDPANSNGGI